MRISSGKKTLLLSIVGIATAAAVFSAKRSSDEDRLAAPPSARREAITRRLPSLQHSMTGARHVFAAAEEPGFKVPTVATASPADPHVGAEFGPSLTAGYGHAFNPAAALLETPPLTADGGQQPAAEPLSDEAPPTGKRKHVVVDGDTLTRLAARYLGSSERYLEIYAANRNVLGSPDLLPIGATLEMPPADRPEKPAAAKSQPPAADAADSSAPGADAAAPASRPAGNPRVNPLRGPALESTEGPLVPVPRGALGDED